MIRRIEAWHYRALKRVDVALGRLNILVGPNGSGKSTLLDVLAFLQQALTQDIERAVRSRARTLAELVWQQERVLDGFDLAIEADVPPQLAQTYARVRYELNVGLTGERGTIGTGPNGENLGLIQAAQAQSPLSLTSLADAQRAIRGFPSRRRRPIGAPLQIVRRTLEGYDYFHDELSEWNVQFKLPNKQTAFAGLPADERRFPVALWLRQLLIERVHSLNLNSEAMGSPTPNDAPESLMPDGANLARVVRDFQEADPQRFGWWVAHLQTVLADLTAINVLERPEDRSLYLMATYRDQLNVPGWMLSDGTLRLMALTLIGYLPEADTVYLIEEPENGIHPKALEAVYTTLANMKAGQVFIATHSPLLLNLAQPEELLIFAKDPDDGATTIVNGQHHPSLQDWQQEVALGTLFAAGVLE